MSASRDSAVVVPLGQFEAGKSSPYHKDPPRSRQADVELSVTGIRLRDWARHLADNSSIVAAVLSARTSNAIGAGLSYEPLVKDRKGQLIPELNSAIRKIHRNWSRSVDVSGELSRPELERLVWRTWDLDGEAFVRQVVQRPRGRSSPVPYRLEMIESDWVPFWLSEDTQAGTFIVHGVEKDSWGRPLRYYIDRDTGLSLRSTRIYDRARMEQISAEDLWHLKRQMRPNQTRGVTLLHSVIFRVSDVAEFEEAHRLAARASADLYASINRSPEVDTDSLSEDQIDSEGKRIWNYDHLQLLDGLLAGESVNFHAPQHPNQNAVDFVREEKRAIASATDVGFSQIAQVYDRSYNAQRLEAVSVWRKTERDRAKFCDDFARDALYQRPLEMAIRSGMLPARALRRADPDTMYDVRIEGPPMPVIDPVKDRQAYVLDVTNRWDSREGVIRKMGRVPADVDAEIDASLDQSAGEPSGEEEDDA